MKYYRTKYIKTNRLVGFLGDADRLTPDPWDEELDKGPGL